MRTITPPAIVERLYHLVLHDPRYSSIGVRGLAHVAIEEATGLAPTLAEVRSLALAFWQHWHELHDRPSRRFVTRSGRRRLCPIEDMLPGQENAVRAMEDGLHIMGET